VRRHVIAAVAVAAVAMALAGCGERPQVVNYKQGTYQGKPDQKAYDTAPWNGNKRDWELALANRNQSQNEYKRIR
jgi:outer membrane protein assembly factor BamE (lipoprotein component of BamABCDE complex)